MKDIFYFFIIIVVIASIVWILVKFGPAQTVSNENEIDWDAADIASVHVQIVFMSRDMNTTTKVYNLISTSSQLNNGHYTVPNSPSDLYIDIGCADPIGDCQALHAFGPFNSKL